MVELIGRYSKQTKPPLIRISTTVEPGPLARPHVHNAQKRLGPDKVAQLIADYQAGEPSTALMTKYQLGKGTVLGILEAHGIERRNQGLSTEQADEAIRLYQQGWSLARVGQHFGRQHTVVRKVLLDAGATLRPRRGWNSKRQD